MSFSDLLRTGRAAAAATMGRLDDVGFERTRRALAALALSLFVSLYLVVALNAPDGLRAAFLALALCYGVAFMAVVAEWFWGRWFATGLGWSGVMVGVASLVMVGWMWPIAVYGGLHGLVVIALLGKKMAARYDLQQAWRERYRMDEFGVARLRKTVTRAAASLPSLILWALGPKDPGQAVAAAAVIALGLAAAGMGGVVRLRSWSLFAFAAAAGLVISASRVLTPSAYDFGGPTLAAICLGGALVPFAGPALRFLRADAR